MQGKRWHLTLLVFVACTSIGWSQTKFLKKSDTLNPQRLKTVYITEASVAAISLLGINQLWYADYEKSNFHLINDANHWLQMDKMGHAFSAYALGKIGMNTLRWAGASKKSQRYYGATIGFIFLSAVEVMDGFSEEWGFSPSDIIANAAGTGLLIGQDLLWAEQRISFKYSFHRTHFAEKRPERLGENFLEQSLKDYNGQTYWLSANVWSFNKESKFPKWLNIAFGYGADGLLYGTNELASTSELGLNYQRSKQFYLSFDVDLTKIKTKSPLLKALFSVINFIKIPTPTVEFSNHGKTKYYLFYF